MPTSYTIRLDYSLQWLISSHTSAFRPVGGGLLGKASAPVESKEVEILPRQVDVW